MKLIIKQHRPLRRALLAVACIGGGLLALAITVDYGHWASIATAMVKTGRKGSLLEEVQQLREENTALQYEMARMIRTAQINKYSRRDDHAELVELQARLAAVNREIEFYRDVLGQTEVETKTQVKGVQLTQLADQGRYSYRLVLTHVDKDNKLAEGSLRIQLKGEQGGTERALKFDEFADSGPQNLSFKFKHFRLFEGTIHLPDGFVPRELMVAVHNTAPIRAAVTETYDWAAVLN